MKEGKDYVIKVVDLRSDHHKACEMAEEAMVALMDTILTVRMMDGCTWCMQFLCDNDLDDRDRQHPLLHILLILLSSLSSSS